MLRTLPSATSSVVIFDQTVGLLKAPRGQNNMVPISRESSNDFRSVGTAPDPDSILL